MKDVLDGCAALVFENPLKNLGQCGHVVLSVVWNLSAILKFLWSLITNPLMGISMILAESPK